MSSAKFRPFTWTPRREQAAELVAQGTLSDVEIARRVGVTDRQLRKWRKHPDFIARVEERKAAILAAIRAEGIAHKQNRLAALSDRWQRLQRIIEARAKEHANVPGGDTGLLIRQVKLIKVYNAEGEGSDEVLYSAKREIEVAEYAVDTGLLRELREHEKQAAQELGQWSEGKTDAVLKYIDLTKLTNEQLERLANGDDPLKVLLGS